MPCWAGGGLASNERTCARAATPLSSKPICQWRPPLASPPRSGAAAAGRPPPHSCSATGSDSW
eukprot:scaffold429602_cov48-Prasinocladus_malaysianus.AAC.1